MANHTLNGTTAVRIHANWLPAGAFFIWLTNDKDLNLQPTFIKLELFAWHAPSYYGTFLEEQKIDGVVGFVLPAAEAVDYWAAPAVLKHGAYLWDEGIGAIRTTAALIQLALGEGQFIPTLIEDQESGMVRTRWRLKQTGEEGLNSSNTEAAASELIAAARSSVSSDVAKPAVSGIWDNSSTSSDFADEWLDAAIRQLVQESGMIQDMWNKVEAAYPAASSLRVMDMKRPAAKVNGIIGIADDTDEIEWLEMIGFSQDDLPVRTGLRLEEPEKPDGLWRLVPLMITKDEPQLIYPCTPAGEMIEETGGPAAAAWLESFKSRLTSDVLRWHKLFPEFEWELNDEVAWRFLEKGSLRISEKGFPVFLPRWWDEVRKLKPRVRAHLKSSSGSSGLFGPEQLIQFEWKLAIGDTELSRHEFDSLVEQNRRLIRWNNQWVPLHPSWLQAFKAFLRKSGKRDSLRLSEVLELYLLGGRDEAIPSSEVGGMTAEGHTMTEEDSIRVEVCLNEQIERLFVQLEQNGVRTEWIPPANLKGTLRPYQADGVSWLLFLQQCGFGACLADDMGLGKTIQFIAYLLHRKEKGKMNSPMLLICPTSVLGNWQKEIERFADGVKLYLHYGSGRVKGDDFQRAVADCDLVITSYALALLDKEELSTLQWSAICLDEAQNIKNPHGKQSSAIRGLNSDHRIAMTGTPVENRLTELWSIFDFTNAGYLGSLSQFQKRYANPIEEAGDLAATERLQRLIRPFLLRRVKTDPTIQLDLPDKNETNVYVTLTAEQGVLYEQVLQDMLETIDLLSPMERRGIILASLTKLKRICDHPALYLREEGTALSQSGKRSAMLEAEGLKQRSNKLQRLVEMVREVLEEGDRCLIFTQYVEMGKILSRVLEQECGHSVQFLHGGISKEQRDCMVERFQDRSLSENQQQSIFVLSLKAGGIGLNLTAASHVFHFDRWWNPAVENQATDRAYRIGQTKDVQVHKLVALGTLEERIDEMIERKRQLSQQIIGAGENWITELSTGELKELFSLRKEWLRA